MCVSYILSSFYYATLEQQALEFLRKDEVGWNEAKQDEEVPEKQGKDINCLMRLTDDYLLMTTSKSNAMLFIEKLYKLSQVSNFKFNRKKLKTSFQLNLERIGIPGGAEGQVQNIDKIMCDWIGISIDMATLQLIPNINTSKEAQLCTLNVNMQTNQSVVWLKKKLKS